MKTDKPILFSGPMVRAILDGRKTQTRRVVKPQPSLFQKEVVGAHWVDPFFEGDPAFWAVNSEGKYLGKWRKDCPYGQPGGLLWVRETFADVNSESGPGFAYRADESFGRPDYDGPDYGAGPSFDYDKYPRGSFSMWYSDLLNGAEGHSWKPSIHMPRWASRITLEITGVRVERLQDISEDDARAEGIPPFVPEDIGSAAFKEGPRWYRHNFEDLWQSINGPGSWDANPWVWVVEFNPHQMNIDDYLKTQEGTP